MKLDFFLYHFSALSRLFWENAVVLKLVGRCFSNDTPYTDVVGPKGP